MGVRDLFREEDLPKECRTVRTCMPEDNLPGSPEDSGQFVVGEWTHVKRNPCRGGTFDARTIRVCGATTCERFTLTHFEQFSPLRVCNYRGCIRGIIAMKGEKKNIQRKKVLEKDASGCFCVLDINGNKDAGWKWKVIIIGGGICS